ncbi:DUF4256 domain-containing protein [Flavobacterium terrae]|uniref:DUF4256 domain-containing protein n=1 Tax=Flavobacterium terrae TaxID=415425 RepID=A0A1M6EIA8_9FLAO|nr:DUF4256 domain-containing protein [Flavobacterium terrae]SHI85181.1 Protein of unknown function [Flavobacterium terrae]
MNKALSVSQEQNILSILERRFEDNTTRHKNLQWNEILKKLNANPEKLWSLNLMEETGGEPDVIGFDIETNQYIFCDCSVESPKGRRSLCYDHSALESRKEHKPQNSVEALADEIGIDVLTETQYRELQQLGKFDLKTSSWIQTPESIRKLGGALFCDRRYDAVFVYHNGAESYYAARGFRGILKV